MLQLREMLVFQSLSEQDLPRRLVKTCLKRPARSSSTYARFLAHVPWLALVPRSVELGSASVLFYIFK